MAPIAPLRFGQETEYSLVPVGAGGETLDRADVAAQLFASVCARAPHLRDVTGLGYFFGSGRLYLDRGRHPEFATRECAEPGELVRRVALAEGLLAEAVRDYERAHPGACIYLSGCSVDYSGTGSTWGTHESYLSSLPPTEIAPALVPFLITRLVFSGAGGFDNRGGPARFLLSPRAVHCEPLLWGERSLLSKRDEPLCVGHCRVHVAYGESLRSPLASWLKVGTTALVVRLIEAGALRASDLSLSRPANALQVIAEDVRCRERVALTDGRTLTALEIQAHYLGAAERHADRVFMPPWAAQVCRAWRRILERLGGAPDSVADRLDWAVKHRLFEQLQRNEGLGASDLFEADVRYADLVPERSLYGMLSRAGQLSDVFPIASRSSRGSVPPGRAALRAWLVRQLSGSKAHRADWEGIVSLEHATLADLRDPHESKLRWRSIEDGSREWHQDGLVDAVLSIRR